jgi:predicted glycoside hydrolase/deacetylase ChbG (UPF0249 family)
MACGKEFHDGVQVLKDLDKNDVGVHLTLTGGLKPASLDSSKISSLLNSEGLFYPDYKTFAIKYLKRKIDSQQIYLELKNQIEKVLHEGLNVTHLDSHEHIHMFPKVLEKTASLAEEFEIPYIRVPVEPCYLFKKEFKLKDLVRHCALSFFNKKSNNIFTNLKIKKNDYFLGHFHSGRINEEVLRFMTDNMKDGINELAVHICTNSSLFKQEFPWYKNGSNELKTLMDTDLMNMLEEKGIELISHKEV